MEAPRATPATPETTVGPAAVTVRYWASARAAAGVASEELPVPGPVSLAEIVSTVVARHPGALAGVLGACSVLVGDRPVGALAPETVTVHPGEFVEFLPPFAGG